MYAAMTFESSTTGMGTGAFSVLLLRLTEKRFSATQYALFSSVFAIGRTISGPIAGSVVDAIGWRDFFIFTVPCALPGLVMLHRFAPWGMRDFLELSAPNEKVVRRPLSGARLGALASLAGGVGMTIGLAFNALLAATKLSRAGKPFDFLAALNALLHPSKPGELIDLASAIVFGVLTGLGVAAYLAARSPSPRAERA
jgi:PAT family beta-lactamase induction signal transducer AmpG